MKNKKTLIVGASNNPERYAYKAAHSLVAHGHEIENLGTKIGVVAGKAILQGNPILENIHTITLYIGAAHQPPMYEYLIQLKPERIIFNPGTENIEFEKLANQAGIETLEACTLVLLATNQY